MQHVVCAERGRQRKRPIHVTREQTKAVFGRIGRKQRHGRIRIAGQAIEDASETFSVLQQKDVRQKPSDQAGCTADQKAAIPQRLPRKRKRGNGGNVRAVERMIVELHIHSLYFSQLDLSESR